MTSEILFEMLSGIDSGLVEKASEDMLRWQSSQEGVVVPAEPRSHRSFLKITAICAACAAVFVGVFALIMNVRKNGIGTVPDPVNSQQNVGMIGDNGVQTFTNDFDGLVLTVTTDKSEYKIGEPIYLTASLENNTGKDIYLWYEGVGNVNSVILIPCFSDLIQYPINSDLISSGYPISSVNMEHGGVACTVKKGEKCVQDFTFQTYTNYYFQDVTEVSSGVVCTPDYDKVAEPGVHTGELRIKTYSGADRPESYSLDNISTYTLEFSVTIIPADEDSENPSQTFTKDFDGLVLTVTTDKTEYNIGEPIELTATLENNTGEDITLWYSTTGSIGYDGQKAGTTAELMPYFDNLIEYPMRSAVWFDEAITEITFKQGEKCVQHFTFQTYTGYTDIESATGEYKDSVIPDLNKPAKPGLYFGGLYLTVYYEAEEDYKYPTLNFSVTINGESSDDNSVTSEVHTTEIQYTEEMLKDYFFYNDVLYTNCYTCPVDWVSDVDFSEVAEHVTTIKERKPELQSFENDTANVLPVGTEIFGYSHSDILIAKVGDEYIPYLKIVEG